MEAGGCVVLEAYGGEQITRRVVAVSPRTVQVCSEKDYEAARRGDLRAVVGFPIGDVLKVEPAAFASQGSG